jgi:hypothetical protein
MVWICGISVGTALFTAVAAAKSGAASPLNPFHTGPGVGYSDAFLALAVPLILLLLLTPKLGDAGKKRYG